MTKGPTKFLKQRVRLIFNRLSAGVGIERAANIYPELYEAFLSSPVPAREIVFVLKTMKKETGEKNGEGRHTPKQDSFDFHT